jgi:tetratricopeptide (TPR) repeat protein
VVATVKGKKKRKKTGPVSPVAQPASASARLMDFLLILAAGFVVYWNSLEVPFQFDDEAGIVSNLNLRDLSEPGRVLLAGGHLRPVLNLTYALNYHWGQLDPVGYHVWNILFHVLAAAVVYLIVDDLFQRPAFEADARSTQPRRLALWTALFFVAHPVNTEAVTYIWGRSDLLCGLFFLAAVFFFTKAHRLYELRQLEPIQKATRQERWYVIGSLTCFLLAMGAKEIAVSLPIVLLLIDYCFTSPWDLKKWLRKLAYHSPFLVLGLARVVLQFSPFIRNLVNPALWRSMFNYDREWPEGLTAYTNVLTQPHVFVQYLKLLFFPADLSVDHGLAVARSPFDPWVLISVALLIGLVAAGMVYYRKTRLILFCGLWFLAPLSFYVFLPLPELLVDRRLYLPSVAFCLFLAAFLHRGWELRLPSVSNKAAVVLRVLVPTLIVASYSIATFNRNALWQDPVRLWSDAVQKSPEKERPRTNLAAAYLRRGMPSQAAEILKEAVRIHPTSGKIRHNLLSATVNAGQINEAIDQFRELLRIHPAAATRWYMDNHRKLNLKGRFDQAVFEFEKEVRTNSASADAQLALGLIYLHGMNNEHQAVFYLEQGLKGEPKGFRRDPITSILEDLKKKNRLGN